MGSVRYWIWLPFVLAASPAYAHSSLPGIKGFYVGLLHPFSTPSQAVLMLGAGLLAGGFIAPRSGLFFATFLSLSLLGAAFGPAAAGLDTALFAVACASCAYAALMPGRGTALALVLTALAGFLIGAASIPDPGPLQDRLFTMSGSIIGANLGLLYLWGAINFVRNRLQTAWVAIVFRIIAAWIGAIALLMLALNFAAASA